MGAPQIIMIVMISIGLGISLVNHGKEKVHKESVVTTIVSSVLTVLLLWWGGFWH